MVRNLVAGACFLGALVLAVHGITNAAGVPLFRNPSANQLQEGNTQANRSGTTNFNTRRTAGTQGFTTGPNNGTPGQTSASTSDTTPAQPRRLVFPALW